MSEIQDILRSNASKLDVALSEDQQMVAIGAMRDYALRYADQLLSEQNKSVNLEAIKLFPALFVGEWKLWLRKRSFLKAKKAAQIQADIEGRPFYVIRSTQIAYVIQSTKKVRELKRRRFYRKNVTAMKMQEVADFTAYPKDMVIPKDRENGAK